MKYSVRRWLGIEAIFDWLGNLQTQNYRNENKIDKLSKDIGAQNAALARIIAKLDPMFGVSEFDPARIAASKKLEDEIINRLHAEQSVIESKGLRP